MNVFSFGGRTCAMAYNIADLFEHTVDAVPDRGALICGDATAAPSPSSTSGQPVGHHLLAQGVGTGDHVGIYGQNSRRVARVAMLGVFKIRAVPININFRYVEDELPTCSATPSWSASCTPGSTRPGGGGHGRGPRRCVTSSMIADGSGEDTSRPRLDRLRRRARRRRRPTPVSPARADDHYVIYTGGTTGMPKGVMWRHEDICFALGGGIDAYTNERATDGTAGRQGAATEAPWSASTPAAHARRRPAAHSRRSPARTRGLRRHHRQHRLLHGRALRAAARLRLQPTRTRRWDCWGGFIDSATPDQRSTPQRPTPPLELAERLSCPLLAAIGARRSQSLTSDRRAAADSRAGERAGGDRQRVRGRRTCLLRRLPPLLRPAPAALLWERIVPFFARHLFGADR